MLAAQVVHAAGESSPGELPAGTHAVVLSAGTVGLHALSERLTSESVPHSPIIENDPPYENQLMAIGITPARKEEIYPYVRKFELLK